MDERERVVASSGQRFLNFLFDVLFFIAFAFLLGIVLGLLGLGKSIKEMNDYALGIILVLLYYVPQEAMSGQTFGKRITKTRAVNEDGTPLTLLKATGRTMCRFIPFEQFSFLGEQGWHDRISKTKVVSLKK